MRGSGQRVGPEQHGVAQCIVGARHVARPGALVERGTTAPIRREALVGAPVGVIAEEGPDWDPMCE
jgi:hypothetical protein